MNTPVAKLEGNREVFIYEGNGNTVALTRLTHNIDSLWAVEVWIDFQNEFRFVGSLQDSDAIRVLIEGFCGKGE